MHTYAVPPGVSDAESDTSDRSALERNVRDKRQGRESSSEEDYWYIYQSLNFKEGSRMSKNASWDWKGVVP